MTPLGLPCWDVIPGSGVRSQAEATCVNGFQYRVRLTSLSDETLKPRSLVPEFVYRASQRSHGTLINPGIQVGCQWKLTWSYKQSTPHMCNDPADIYVCTCDTAVGLNWPNPVQLHCARVYPSPSRFPTRFPWYKLLPKQSGPDRPPAQYNWTKSSLYSCQEFKLSKSQAGCWQWEFAS